MPKQRMLLGDGDIGQACQGPFWRLYKLYKHGVAKSGLRHSEEEIPNCALSP